MSTDRLKTLATVTLPDYSQCDVVLLHPAFAGAVAALHNKTIAALSTDEKAWMLNKTRHYFAAHMRRAAGNAIIGLIRDNEIIAQSMILHPTTAKPATGMVDMAPIAPPQQFSIMQAVSVKPGFRGAGLMALMIDQWIIHAQTHKRTDLLAEIHVHNAASWVNFISAGLNLVSIGTDPSDGVLVYNAHEKTAAIPAKRLTTEFNRYAGFPQKQCAPDDLLTQSALMADGYAITGRE
ncbi:MAG: hypothetical protein KKA05_05665, partial [Alphaproteobacteria bacterium]|nr:hypothetical protein [Alphaproteobacteria bacterium]